MKFGKLTRGFGLAITFAATIPTASAHYAPLDEWRCAQDSFGTVEEVQERLNWAFKCLPDKMEDFLWHKNANDNTHPFPQGTRIAYPVFGVVAGDGAVTVLQAPRSGAADCSWLEQVSPGSRVRIVGYCGLGCLTPDQVVEFGEGLLPIGSKEARAQKTVMTLAEGAKLESIQLKETPLRQIVTDTEAHKQPILVIKTASGGMIKVTENHPLVDQDGKIRRGDEMKTGDSLVTGDGKLDQIVSIERTEYFGKVYNIRVESPKIEENIYLAQGYLNGSIKLQNEYVRFLNRRLLRHGDLIDMEGI